MNPLTFNWMCGDYKVSVDWYRKLTPNRLFKETKELNNTTVIVDPGNKTDYEFSTNINASVKNAIK